MTDSERKMPCTLIHSWPDENKEYLRQRRRREKSGGAAEARP